MVLSINKLKFLKKKSCQDDVITRNDATRNHVSYFIHSFIEEDKLRVIKYSKRKYPIFDNARIH